MAPQAPSAPERAALAASPRIPSSSRAARRERRGGRVPAVVYGAGKPVAHVAVAREDLVKVLRERRRVVPLEVEGRTESVLLQEVVFHPIDDDPMHVDFLRISEKTLVRVKVPLEFIGHPKAVMAGGEFIHTLAEVEIECLPGDIPASIPVKVAHLEIGQSIAVKDLELPAGVKVLNEPGTTVCLVRVHHEEEAAAPAPAETAAVEPERIGRKAADEEGEEAAEEGAKPEAKGKKEPEPKGKKEKEKE
ncbi:MAG TPA: 50S ribosomal protein L25 [Planctomycetota bacterium]|jgi:large subunit ribosomal protein L25|nr:50S ribosomal protein L25 [Planctomycetota bacterium]